MALPLPLASPLAHLLQNTKRTKEDKVSDEYLKYAIMSDAAYKASRQPYVYGLGVDKNWKLDRKLTKRNNQVWVNESTKEIVVTYRGTKAARDFFTDISIALGTQSLTTRFKQSEEHFEDVVDKFGEEYRYVVTGHSLGGSLARHIHHQYQDLVDESHSFNPGQGLCVWECDQLEHEHIHHIEGDPLSMLSAQKRSKNTHVYNKSADNRHTIANFL